MAVRGVMRSTAVHITHGLDFWLGISKFSKQTSHYVQIYGFPGLFLPYILSYDVYGLVQSVLNGEDNDDLIKTFCDNQVKETSIVAMIVLTPRLHLVDHADLAQGSVIAGNAVAALGKPLMSAVPWPAAAFMQASLVAALFCIYHSMRLNRIVGGLNTPEAIKNWLRASPHRVRSRDKNRPSISAVLILDTPRTLVTMASVGFVVAWTLYVFFVYIWDLDAVAGAQNTMNIMIFYGVSLWLAIAIYLKADIFDYYTDKEQTFTAVQQMLVTVSNLFAGRPTDDDDEYYGYPSQPGLVIDPPLPRIQSSHHTSHLNEVGQMSLATPSERSERKSLGNALLAEALRESIDARRKAIESDEQFVRALQAYHPDMQSSYNS